MAAAHMPKALLAVHESRCESIIENLSAGMLPTADAIRFLATHMRIGFVALHQASNTQVYQAYRSVETRFRILDRVGHDASTAPKVNVAQQIGYVSDKAYNRMRLGRSAPITPVPQPGTPSWVLTATLVQGTSDAA